jgi:transcriptional regulator with XRE-family HTH domain
MNQVDFAERIGRVIASHRKSRGLKQEEVAEQLEIGVEAVSRIERGVATPSLSRFFELADMFDCEVSDLLTEVSSRPADQTARISTLLEGLSIQDRELVLNTLSAIAGRLKEE